MPRQSCGKARSWCNPAKFGQGHRTHAQETDPAGPKVLPGNVPRTRTASQQELSNRRFLIHSLPNDVPGPGTFYHSSTSSRWGRNMMTYGSTTMDLRTALEASFTYPAICCPGALDLPDALKRSNAKPATSPK